jgi:hypothetical protein
MCVEILKIWNLKVFSASEGGDPSGQCDQPLLLCAVRGIFQDSKGYAYVGLRWHDQSGPKIVDGTVLLPRLKLRPHDKPRSYSVLPAISIHNGALLMSNGAHNNAIMPPRELKEHVPFNTAEA